MTKIFFDTEFTGLHQNTSLISIGLVAETGESFYAEFTDYRKDQMDNWLQKNVIDNLRFNQFTSTGIIISNSLRRFEMKANSNSIMEQLEIWLQQFGGIEAEDSIEMWSDCLSYDWVLFCQLWGHAFSIPKCIYYIPFDLCTSLKEKGFNPDVNRENFAGNMDHIKDLYNWKNPKHNALWDAHIIEQCYYNLHNGF